MGGSCSYCESIGVLWSQVSYGFSKKRQKATSDTPHPGPTPAGTEAVPASTEGKVFSAERLVSGVGARLTAAFCPVHKKKKKSFHGSGLQ